MDKKEYKVLHRLRHSGTLYQPNTEKDTVSLSKKEAIRLSRFGAISLTQNGENDDKILTPGIEPKSTDAEKKAQSLQSLNDQLVEKVRSLKSDLEQAENKAFEITQSRDAARVEVAELVEKLADADRANEELTAQLGQSDQPKPADAGGEETPEVKTVPQSATAKKPAVKKPTAKKAKS
ncbi:MAG: hypothetical protein ABJO27_19135 [Pseudoruegeria sp.]